MLPPDGRCMGQQIVPNGFAGRPEMRNGVGHVGRVPVDDRRDHEVQAGCPILLGLMTAIDDPPLAEGIDGLRQSMALFALV